MDEYIELLRSEVLGDQKIITYRLLSRVLKVNVQTAKEMLWHFHTLENAMRPDSVYATYLLTGHRKPKPPPKPDLDDEGDSMMQSSPFESSMMIMQQQKEEEKSIKSIVVVPQDKLEATKAAFMHIQSIHVYSVQPAPLTDFGLIASVGHELLREYNKEDPVEMGGVYGSISNPEAKRRGKPAMTLSPEPVKPTVKVEKKTEATAESPKATPKTSTTAGIKKERSDLKAKGETPNSTDNEGSQGSKKASQQSKIAPKKPATKGAFFANWSSGAAAQKVKSKKTEKLDDISNQKTKEPVMKMDTDSEGENEAAVAPQRDIEEDIRKRKAKDAELAAMMEMEDERPAKRRESSPEWPSSPDEEPEEPEPEQPEPEREDTPPPPPVVSVGGRRRGKRKITKKVTSKDEDGYLVTNTESVWESFSEDEPEPPAAAAPKPKPKAKPKQDLKVGSTKAEKAETEEKEKEKIKGKPAAKGKGQGNLMSFFQKR